MVEARDWVGGEAGAIIGLPVEEAAAAVRGAGLLCRVAGPGAVLTLEFRPDRVTLSVDDHGRVLGVDAG